jgi:4-amino-4-deoxy-L-arabinose transferase-like glycosyltransferase
MRLAVGAIATGAFAALLCVFGPKAAYTIDGYDYAIVMLMDRGMPYAQAQQQAEKFYATQPEAKNPIDGRWLRRKPEYWELFSVRRFDPWLASWLYPYRGFRALVDVSRLGYVATAMLVVVLVARFAPVGLGVLLSVALSLFPPWRSLASLALTDTLAVALTTASLIAALAYLERGSSWRLLLFAGLCEALAFTRPITYVVAGAAAVAWIVALWRHDREIADRALWLLAFSSLWTAIAALVMQNAHAPGFAWIVADSYHHMVIRGYEQPGQNLALWYLKEEFEIAWHAMLRGLATVLPVLAIIGGVLRWRDSRTPFIAGACAATWLGALLDPDRFDMLRCVVIPVMPALAALAAVAISHAVTLVPRRPGPATYTLRHVIPGRFLPRKDTVKE